MKNKSIIFTFLFLSFQSSFAGGKLKIGLRASPAISFAGIRDKSDDLITYSSKGVGARAILGPMFEFFMTDNASFGTGLWYSPRSVSFQSKIKLLNKSHDYKYNLQYLMLPIYFKFYTNPITEKMKLYFTVGTTVDIKIAEKRMDEDEVGAVAIEKPYFNVVDFSLMLGTGVEFALNESNAFFVGVGYNRGLLNIVNPLKNKGGNGIKSAYDALAIKNNVVSLDLGFKF